MTGKASVVMTSLDAAAEYVRMGWRVVPVPAGTKGPRISNWPQLRLTESDLPSHFPPGTNVGLILGEPSGWLVDVDIDGPHGGSIGDLLLPRTDRRHGHQGKPNSHHFYTSPEATSAQFKDIDGSMLAEIRSTGLQTLAPPSRHPGGHRYEWAAEGESAAVGPVELRAAVAQLAAGLLLVRHWPVVGSHHHAANALAGMLLRSGWSDSRTEAFIQAVASHAGDEEVQDRVRTVASTSARLRSGGSATGAPSLASILGDRVVGRCRDWLQLEADSEEVVIVDSSDWPTPGHLGDELLPVPAFGIELLPLSFRGLVGDISERMQAPADFAAVAIIVALAGCVNRRAEIRPKVHDDSWRVVPNLWGAIVAPPGMMKSPILQAITAPLRRIEDRWRTQYDRQVAKFAADKEQADLELQAWKEQYKQSFKSNKAVQSIPKRPETCLLPPVQRRIVTSDATFEKLHAILTETPAGVFVIRDELTGWLAALDKQGREDERAFYLESWNGNGAFTIDRIGRGSVHAPAVCVSLFGNIQPARLHHYLSDAEQGGPTDDGLFQRFQVIAWPDAPRSWRLIDRPVNRGASETAERIFASLAELDATEPICLSFAPDAQELFFEWWSNLEHRIRGTGLAQILIGHLAKYRKLLPALAGLFELADRAADGDVERRCSISIDHTRQAIAMCDYLDAHARRIYACALSPEVRAARDLARHIQAGDLTSPFSTRDVYLKGWAGLDRPDRVRPALALLEEAAWLRRVETPPARSGGRPSEIWLLNPLVVTHER